MDINKKTLIMFAIGLFATGALYVTGATTPQVLFWIQSVVQVVNALMNPPVASKQLSLPFPKEDSK